MKAARDYVAKADLTQGLSELRDNLALEIVKTNARMDAMESRLIARMDAGFERITRIVDTFAEKLETYARESVTLPNTLDLHGKLLLDHERRLKRLESST